MKKLLASILLVLVLVAATPVIQEQEREFNRIANNAQRIVRYVEALGYDEGRNVIAYVPMADVMIDLSMPPADIHEAVEAHEKLYFYKLFGDETGEYYIGIRFKDRRGEI